MENYTLGLALYDYLPVIAAGFGLYLICKYSAILGGYRGFWIVAIPVIALIGGATKASWKLLWALQQINYQWMSDQLFFFLATAYILLATFVIANFRAWKRDRSLGSNWWWVAVVFVVIVVGLSAYLKVTMDGRLWSVLLLAALSMANLVFLITLIMHSVNLRNWLAVGAFAGNLVLSYALVGLARLEQTAPLQWIEQSLNLVNNSLLAVGAWALMRALKREAR